MRISKENILSSVRYFVKLIQRKPPIGDNGQPQKPWRTFEQIFCWRSNIMSIILLIGDIENRLSEEDTYATVNFYCNGVGVREST